MQIVQFRIAIRRQRAALFVRTLRQRVKLLIEARPNGGR
jgi:hypothetical protein